MSAPFFVFLDKKHTIPRATVVLNADTDTLQALLDANDTSRFERLRQELRETGRTFQITDMKVYEPKYQEGDTVDVKIALQVKGSSITWYFWAPDAKDLYSQEFRDRLYVAAAECHEKVDRGCSLYYRGSNAFHVKSMHHLESEAGYNHNHYRMGDNLPVTPHDLSQHLEAFGKHQQGEFFLSPGEVERINGEFAQFYAEWTAIDAHGTSPEQRYLAKPTQKLNEADLIELSMFGIQQEPCRISAEELKLDYERARKLIEDNITASHDDPGGVSRLEAEKSKIFEEYTALLDYRKKGGSRGLGSERAMTRQIEGSSLPAIEVVAGKDDALGKEVPAVPEWAQSVFGDVMRAKARIAVAEAQLAQEKIALSAADETMALASVLEGDAPSAATEPDASAPAPAPAPDPDPDPDPDIKQSTLAIKQKLLAQKKVSAEEVSALEKRSRGPGMGGADE